MGLNAAVQALKKAEPLKDKVQSCRDLLNDSDAWVCQQQLQKIYQQVLILDLEYALDRKVEQELWNLGFKNYIATLQSQAKDRKNPKRGESQALLGWCLEAASGFYLTLLQEICTAFDLDLPFRRKGYIYGCTSPWKAIEKLSVPHKSSCFYACQYCLVHLGDIARYRNESKQAELFYRHAVSLSPSSGQPYNQLALLEASRGNRLATVFHYTRSVAVKHPFPVATSNLAKTLASALNDTSLNIEGKTKLSSQEYIGVFLKLHGVIHNLGDTKLATTYTKLLTETLTALIATESFTSWMLVQMFAINLYALEYTSSVVTGTTEAFRSEQLTTEEKIARDCILDLIAGSLSALLLPVYTIKNSIVEYFALPCIKLCLDWIHAKPAVLEESAFASRLQIWPSLCVLLNALQNYVTDFTYDQYVKVPLPEDRDLQGFLPLEKSLEGLKFATSTDLEDNVEASNKLRAVRILRLGHCLARYRVNGSALIAFTAGEKPSDNKFSSISEGNGLSNELIKELEELSLNRGRQSGASSSPVLSESASSKGSTDVVDATEQHGLDKRIGILKPRGSLERSKDATTVSAVAAAAAAAAAIVVESNAYEPNAALPTARKPRQNIAMQTIMRRAENEQKQVTFKNVSPLNVEEESERARAASVSVSPIRSAASTGSKTNSSIVAEASKVNNLCNAFANAPTTVQTRPPPMVVPLSTIAAPPQSQAVSNQPQGKGPILQHTAPQSAQPNHLATGEQQASGISIPIHHEPCQLPVGTICYPSPTFNVQNPQFTKNYATNHLATISNYCPIQGHFPSSPQPQSVQPHNPGLLHNRPMQNAATPRPSGKGVPTNAQPSHNLCLQQQQQQQQQQNVASNLRSNAMSLHSQVALTSSPVAHLPTLSTLNTYQKKFHRIATTIPNVPPSSLNSTPGSNFQLNFNQNAFCQIPQKQLASPIYGKNSDMMEFSVPGRVEMSKSQPRSTNNYPLFQNYDAANFGLWKDTQHSRLSIPCWGASTATATAAPLHAEDASSVVVETYNNWEDTSDPTSVISQLPARPCNSYPTDSQRANHFGSGNNFESSRSPDVDAKSNNQPVNTGNTYSLFSSSNSWGTSSQSCNNASNADQTKARLNQQSLWFGPGPSPLERLLEQQKSLREGGT